MENKIKSVMAAFVVAIMFVLFGCSNNLINGTIEGVNGSLALDVTTNYTKDSGVARYIGPDNWTNAELEGLTFKINGSSLNGDVVVDYDPHFDSNIKGKIQLSYDIWELTLSAYAGDNLVLEGNTYADLTAGGSKIVFDLTTKGITTVGGLDLSGTYTGDGCKSYTMRLIDFYTGKEIAKETVTESEPATKTVSYTNDSVAPGSYLFEVRFSNGTKEIGYWADEVRVVPGKTTAQTDIDFGEMMKKPDAPTDLKVTNIADSETGNGTYNVKLEWKDKSINEENFLIYIYEYETWLDDASRTLVKILGTENNDDTKEVDFLTDVDTRVSGTLLSGHEECVITLKTGTIYDFEIASENCVGESETVCTRIESTDYKATGTENVAKTMITYNLNGGIYTDANGVYAGTTIIEWKQYKGTNLPLMTIPADATLTLGGHDFSGWALISDYTQAIVDDISTSDLYPTTTDGVSDMVVYAQFLTETEIEVNVEDFTNPLTAANVTAIDKDGASVKNQTIDVKDTTQQITFNVADTENFDNFRVTIDGITVYEGSVGTAWTMSSFTRYASRAHTIIVSARRKTDRLWFGDQFKVTFAR